MVINVPNPRVERVEDRPPTEDALAHEIADKPKLSGAEATYLAGEIAAHAILAWPQDLRGKITRSLDSPHSTALTGTGRSLAEEPRASSSAMETVGPKLMAINDFAGLNTALARIMALPAQLRLAPLQALASAIPRLPWIDRYDGFEALTKAADSLQPCDCTELLNTLSRSLLKDPNLTTRCKPPANTVWTLTRRSAQ